MVGRNQGQTGEGSLRLRWRLFLPALAVALIASMLTGGAALADEVVIQSEPWAGETTNVITITQLPDQSIVVNNPGSAAPVSPQCSPLPGGGGLTTCAGGPTRIKPVDLHVQGLFGDMPLGSLWWVVDEAAAAIAALHGVTNDDLVYAYGRGEIRAYVTLRLIDILDKKLYGEPMTAREDETYAALVEALRVREVERAKRALNEWERWTTDPCRYPVPAPPSPELPVIANDVAQTAKCSQANRLSQLWEFLQGTPSTDVFEKWASYRSPGRLMAFSSHPDFREAVGRTNQANVFFGSLGAAVAATGLFVAGLLAFNAIVASGLTSMLWLTVGVTAFAGFTIAAAAAFFAAIVAFIVVIGFSIFIDLSGAADYRSLFNRVWDAIESDDPMGVIASQPAYAGLDYTTRERPSDPDDVATHQEESFHNQLTGMVMSWTSLSSDGEFTPDGIPGGVDLPHRPDDMEFHVTSILDDGVEQLDGPTTKEWIAVRAPDGTVDGAGNEITGYKVSFSRGWLMVSRSVHGQYQVLDPQLSLEYVRPGGGAGQVSVVQHLDENGEAVRQFLLASTEGGETTGAYSDEWAFRSVGSRVMTTELDMTPPETKAISLLPTVTGKMVPGGTLTLAANVSTPGANAGGVYTWKVELKNDAADVVQTWTHDEDENLLAFQQKFNQTGNYQATVRFRGSDAGDPFDVSGIVPSPSRRRCRRSPTRTSASRSCTTTRSWTASCSSTCACSRTRRPMSSMSRSSGPTGARATRRGVVHGPVRRGR